MPSDVIKLKKKQQQSILNDQFKKKELWCPHTWHTHGTLFSPAHIEKKQKITYPLVGYGLPKYAEDRLPHFSRQTTN